MGSSRSKRIENSRTASGDGNKGMFVGDQDHGLPTSTKLETHSHRLPSEKLVLQGQLQRRHATGKRWGGWGELSLVSCPTVGQFLDTTWFPGTPKPGVVALIGQLSLHPHGLEMPAQNSTAIHSVDTN